MVVMVVEVVLLVVATEMLVVAMKMVADGFDFGFI